VTGDAAAEARQYGRTVGALTVALAVAGALTYLFFGVASHALGADAYGRIVVLWAVVFITISTVFRPVEQLLARTIADLDAQGKPIAHALRVAASIQLGLALLIAVVALAARGALEGDLLSGDPRLFVVMVVAVLAYAVSLFIRGAAAGSRQFGSYTAIVVVDATARLAFALAVAIGIGSGERTVALGVAAGPLLSVVVAPFALRGRRQAVTRKLSEMRASQAASPGEPAPGGVEGVASELSLAEGSGFAAAVLAMMLTEQILLNGGALFARAETGAAAAGFVFNVLMVARAPVVLFQAVAASLLPHLTRLRARPGEGDEAAFRLSVKLTVQVIAAFALAASLALLAVGPTVMQIAFGTNFDYDRLGLVIVAVGMGAYLSAATLNQAALARGQARVAALCWALCGATFIAWNLLSVFDIARQVELGFAGASALLCALLFVLYRTSRARSGDGLTPGSPEELELQLAVADEAI
jgi:O-antigen/teichoic acid export membrane protein